MVKIPGGTVDMLPIGRDGQFQLDGKPIKVEIKPFWISKTELTWDLYDPWALMWDLPEDQVMEQKSRAKELKLDAESRPSPASHYQPDCGFGHQGYAAICVHANSAERFCWWLSRKTGKKYRLPTEAEWEHVCRAGGPADKLPAAELDKVAWYGGNSKNEGGDLVAHAVATKAPNAWGVHDMLGNVSEWVMGMDGKPVLKGGSYQDRGRDVHCRARFPYDETWQQNDTQYPKSIWWLSDGKFAGFRIVREE
jgi:formylglycine-generating enzyme required for sulfatase activity